MVLVVQYILILYRDIEIVKRLQGINLLGELGLIFAESFGSVIACLALPFFVSLISKIFRKKWLNSQTYAYIFLVIFILVTINKML